jgi:S1-C subfamily serine protease
MQAQTGPQAAEKTIPQLVRDTQDCIYRVEVRGLVVVKVVENGKAREGTEPMVFAGTGFTIATSKPAPRRPVPVDPVASAQPRATPTTGVLASSPPFASAAGPLAEAPAELHPVGYLVTNCHVVSPPDKVFKSPPSITVRNRRGTFTAKVVGQDPFSDLAVLELEATGPMLRWSFAGTATATTGQLPTLSFTAADSLEVGEEVVAIGFGRALDGPPTVSHGILGAIDRSVGRGAFSGLLQTDATINHGNSGGPLLNRRGEVVGVNTYLYGDILELQLDVPALKKLLDSRKDERLTMGETMLVKQGEHVYIGRELDVTQGMFYARSCATARPFVEQLLATGRVTRLDVGIGRVQTVGKMEAEAYALAEGGVVLLEVQWFSRAMAAGLRKGDVIDQIGPYAIQNLGDIRNALGLLPRDKPFMVSYVRPAKVSLDAINAGNKLTNSADIQKALTGRKRMMATIQPK